MHGEPSWNPSSKLGSDSISFTLEFCHSHLPTVISFSSWFKPKKWGVIQKLLIIKFLRHSGTTLIAGAGPLYPLINSGHSEALRRCPKAKNWLASHIFHLQLFKEPETPFYELWFCLIWLLKYDNKKPNF